MATNTTTWFALYKISLLNKTKFVV